MVIPGYQGFIPGNKNGSLLGQRYTEQAREVFQKEKMDDRQYMVASTGFNFAKVPKGE